MTIPATACVPACGHPALARARQLVAPGALAAAVQASGAVLLEVGCGGADAYLQAHIPGARYLDTAGLEGGPLLNKVADPVLLETLLALGISAGRSVILYGRNNLAAARAAHLMLYAGVRDVRLLDGGYAAWAALEQATASGVPATSAVPALAFGAPFPGRPDYLIGMADVRQLLARPDGALVSIRTWSEFCGLTSGYGYIAACGEIAGARWGRAGREGDINSMSQFQYPDGRMLPAATIEAQWGAAGIDAGQQVSFYCGTGWRASLAFFYAWLMGWERISVYDGGWFEWSAEPGNPVVRRAAMTPEGA